MAAGVILLYRILKNADGLLQIVLMSKLVFQPGGYLSGVLMFVYKKSRRASITG